MDDKYSIELFPDQKIYPYLHSIDIPYISRWKIKVEEMNVFSKNLDRPTREEWIEILKLEINSKKSSIQKSIEDFFNLDNIHRRILSTLENNVNKVQYDIIVDNNQNNNFKYLCDVYEYNINGQIIFGECKRISGGYDLFNIDNINLSNIAKEYIIQ
jgi:hypothetical protein